MISGMSAGKWQDLAEESEPSLRPHKITDIQGCINMLNVNTRNKPVHPTNYGERLQVTAEGRKFAANPSLIV